MHIYIYIYIYVYIEIGRWIGVYIDVCIYTDRCDVYI